MSKRKNILMLAILCLLGVKGFSQDSHMGLNMGASFPVGDFSSIDDYSTSGYAGAGFDLSFDFNYIPTWYFGIGGGLFFSTNAPNQDSLLRGLVKEMQDNNYPAFPDSAQKAFTVGNWNYVNFMLGPTFAIPAGDFQFNFKAFIGLSVIMPPTQTIGIKYDDNIIAGYSDEQIVNFCYSIGTDVIYKINSAYSIKLGADYFVTKAKYDEDYILNTDNPLDGLSRNIDINSIHTYIGLAYLF